MKLYKFLVLVLMCDALQHHVFCSQERARQLAVNQNNVDEVYNLQVNIQILGEQWHSFIEIINEISDQADNEGYRWEPRYPIDELTEETIDEEIVFDNHIAHAEEYDVIIDMQRFGVLVVDFLIWGLRD